MIFVKWQGPPSAWEFTVIGLQFSVKDENEKKLFSSTEN
jgi:hypothetical protein